MAQIKLHFKNETRDTVDGALFTVLMPRFEKILRERIGDFLGEKKGEINLILVSDEKIWEINRDYRGKNKPTDVISFAYLEDAEVPFSGTVGDIFISVDTARAQAKDHGHDLERELMILFVHGMLHLFGFDHNDDAEEAEMEGFAAKILGA